MGFIGQVQRTNRRFSAPRSSTRRTAVRVIASRPVQRVVRSASPSHIAHGVLSSHGVQHAANRAVHVQQAKQRNAHRAAAIRSQQSQRKQIAVNLLNLSSHGVRLPKATVPKTVFNTKIGPTGIAKQAAQQAAKYQPQQSSQVKVRAARLKEQAGTSLPKPKLSTTPPKYGKGKNQPHPFKAGKGISTAIDTVGRAVLHGDPTSKYRPTLSQAIDRGAKVYAQSHKAHPLLRNKGAAAAVASGPSPAAVKEAANVAKDAINLPAGVPQTASGVAKAGVAAAQGNLKPAKQLYEGLKNHTFIGNALQGHWGKALKQAKDHPLDTYLEFSGAKSIAGRGIGGGLRAGGKVTRSKTLKRAGSTKRDSLNLMPGVKGGPTHPRTHSKDSISKAAQVLHDKHQAKKHGKNNVKPGSRKQKHLLSQKMNADIAMREGVRRIRVSRGTAQVVHQTKGGKAAAVRAKVPKSQAKAHHTPGLTKAHEKAIPLAVERVLTSPKNVARDLKRYRDKLIANPPKPGSHTDTALHEQMVRQVNGLLADKRFLANPHPAFHAAEKVIKGEHPLTQRMLNLHLLSNDEHGARYVPYAIVHMHAKPSAKGLPTVKLSPRQQAAEIAQAQAEHQTHMANAARLTREGTTRGVQAALNKAKAAQAKVKALQASPERHLTADEITAHMQNRANHNGEVVTEPGFFSQRPGATGAGSFYKAAVGRNMKRPALYSKHRSGQATLQGTHEADVQALVAQRAHSENAVTQAEGHDSIISKYGANKDQQGNQQFFRTHSDATTAAQELSQQVGVDLVPVNVGHTKAIQNLLDTGKLEHQTQAGLSDRVQAMFSDTSPGQYTLVPQMLKEKLLASVHPRGKARRVAEELTKHWKASILTTSTHWPAGNLIDVGTRMAGEAIGPTRLLRGVLLHRKVKQVAPAAADEMAARDLAAFYRSQRGMETHRPPNAITRLPVVKQGAGLWRLYRDFAYKVGSIPDKLGTYGALGKWAGQQMDGFMKLGGKGMDDLARGMVHTKNQEAAAQFVERVVGRWGKYSPQMRAVLIHAPFVQWLGVALRYVYVTLPLHHPIKTGIAAGLDEMTTDERKKLGLYVNIFGTDKGQLAPNQQAGVRTGPNSNVLPFGNLSSFGTAAQFATAPVGTLGQFAAAPQLSTALNISRFGLDAFGNPIHNPDGSKPTQFALNALGLYAIAEPLFPFASSARRVMERGGSGAPTSTIFAPKTYGKNPGTTLGAGVAKVFNPLHTQKPFYPNGKGKSGGLPGSNSLPGSGGLPGSSGSLKSLEAQYVKGVGFVNPQAAGQLAANAGAKQAGARKVTAKQAAGILAQSAAKAPKGNAPTVFNTSTKTQPFDPALHQAAGRVLRAAMAMPDVKRWNLFTDRTVMRENPQFRKDVNALWNHLKTTSDLPAWARKLPNPKIRIIPPTLWTQQMIAQRKPPAGMQLLGIKTFGHYPFAALAVQASRTVIFTPDTVHGSFDAFNKGNQNYLKQTPLHEIAHIYQKPLSRAFREGSAEAFAKLSAHDLGLPPAGLAPGYEKFTGQARAKGDKWVSRGQFAGNLKQMGVQVLASGPPHFVTKTFHAPAAGVGRFDVSAALRPVRAAIDITGRTASGLLVQQLHPSIDRMTVNALKSIVKGVKQSKPYIPAGADPNVVQSIIGIGHKRGMSQQEILAALVTAKIEQGYQNKAYGSGGSVGWRQETPGSYGSVANRMNLTASINRFYNEIKGKGAGLTVGQLAQSAQRSRTGAPKYDAAVGEAQKILGGAGPKLTKAQAQAFKALARGQMAKHSNKPVRAGIYAHNTGRIDMGWDVTGSGPVAAFASGVITHVAKQGSGTGWPGAGDGGRGNNGALITLKLHKPVSVGGKTYKYLYFAENMDPKVKVGQRVKAGQTIATARGQMPFTEQGFAADAHGHTSAAGHYTEGQQTAEGKAFYNWVHGLPTGKAWGNTGTPSLGGSTGSVAPATGTPALSGGGRSSGGSTSGGGSAAKGSPGTSNLATTTQGFTQQELQALQLLGLDPSVLSSLGLQTGYTPSTGSMKLPKTAPVRVRALSKAQEKSALV